MRKALFTPLEQKILQMAINDDERVCSLYGQALFEHINFADVIMNMRERLSTLLAVDYNYVRDTILYTEKRIIAKRNGEKTRVGVYRLDNDYKAKIRVLLEYNQDEVYES